jgi:hypothetical protein
VEAYIKIIKYSLMQINKFLIALVTIVIAFIGCELPKQPDFTASHKVEAPILYNKTKQFMGGSDALIDTTKADLDSLFTIKDTSNFITISKEQEFEFGDLNDAVPTVNIAPRSFNSEVGEISLTDFSSSDGALG